MTTYSSEAVAKLIDSLEEHPVYQNPYFDFLINSEWDKDTYELHRANFLYRTELTVKAIALVCHRAAQEDDQKTLLLFSFILNEECGNGRPEHCHEVLMEKAHNLFAERVFGLGPLLVNDAKFSPLIIAGTEHYRKTMQDLCSGSYQRMLGVAMALESHAEKMLTHCRTAFRKFKHHFDEKEFVRNIESYFNCHLNNGVEERHAEDARECVRLNCRSEADYREIEAGANAALDVQLAMWEEMFQNVERCRTQAQLKRGFSRQSLLLGESITHGTRATIAKLNEGLGEEEQVVDLSIGTLDLSADKRIDQGVMDFITNNADTIHAFAAVPGLAMLRDAIAQRINRLHGVDVDGGKEVLVTPGGIKGSLTIAFQTLLNKGDEVIVPIPNWPHYADMLCLHGAKSVFVTPSDVLKTGLNAEDLKANITDKTKLVILGDCINPTGKVYQNDELIALAEVIAAQNVRRESMGLNPIFVIFDCPYEAHVLSARPTTFAALEVDVPDHGKFAMRDYTVTVTGPGKTYGMHGDRIGYMWAPADVVDMAAKVQVNTNSFASTYGQVATYHALQQEMDEVAHWRALQGRANLEAMMQKLTSMSLYIEPPQGGYFLFVDFSEYAERYEALGYERADLFLLKEAQVATISGVHFANHEDRMRHFVRMNCGRSKEQSFKACERIEAALRKLGPAQASAVTAEGVAQ